MPIPYHQSELNLREGFSKLNVWVETRKGWKIKTILSGGGPLIHNSKVYILDIKDVTGPILKIKLIPPKHFWVINHLAVDYSENQPVNMQTLAIHTANGNMHKDIKHKLMKIDENYLILAMNSKPVELTFKSPQVMKASKRSLVLQISGFYDIDLGKQAPPSWQILNLIHHQPGFATQMAYQELLNWKRQTTASVQ